MIRGKNDLGAGGRVPERLVVAVGAGAVDLGEGQAVIGVGDRKPDECVGQLGDEVQEGL